MSIALMTEAWKSNMPSGRKMVLLSLCDNANDQGECFPSIAMVAQRCSMGERTVQGHISDLEAAGVLSRLERRGRSTIYRIDPRRICTPAESAPPQKLRPTPADSAPPPPQILRPTPADSAPITVKEPPIEPSKEPSIKARFVLPDWIDRDLWDAWHSGAKRKKATVQQKELAVKKLTEWRDKGMDWHGALESAAMGGWAGLYAPQEKRGRLSGNDLKRHNDQATAEAARMLGIDLQKPVALAGFDQVLLEASGD